MNKLILFFCLLIVSSCHKETITGKNYVAGVIVPTIQCQGRLLSVVDEHGFFFTKPNQHVKISYYWRYSENEPFLKGDGLPIVKEGANRIQYYREVLLYNADGEQEVYNSNKVWSDIINCG